MEISAWNATSHDVLLLFQMLLTHPITDAPLHKGSGPSLARMA